MQEDVCYQQEGLRRAKRRLAWSAVLLVAGLTGCGGNSSSGNDGDVEVPDKSAQPPESGSYLQMGAEGQEVMSMLLVAEENRYYVSMSDPETNATGSLRGCIVMAAAPLAPETGGSYIARGTDLTDEGCSLSIRQIEGKAIDVSAAGCESSCVSSLAAERLSGTYILQHSLGEQPPSTDNGANEQAPHDQSVESETTQQWPGNVPAASPPIKVEWQGGTTGPKVIGTVDQITVTNVTVNRGNCTVQLATFDGWKKPSEAPRTIGFGEEVGYTVMDLGCPNILEVQVDTDAGPWAFSFQ